MLQFIILAIVFVIIVLILAKLLKFTIKTIFKILINFIIGLAAVFLLNLIPGVAIPLNWLSGIILGVLGLPGAIILLIISFII